jgi:hypothetical protein
MTGAGRSCFEMRGETMSPLFTALIYFGSFLALGLIAKVVIGAWMKRSGVDRKSVRPP